MKQFCLIILLALSVQLHAQNGIDKYPNIPDEFQLVFNDLVAENVTRVLDSGNGQYMGQISDEGQLYGYGIYLTNDGNQCIGQYRNGECIFGIRMTDLYASIGSPTHSANYDLTTGKLMYINHNGEKAPVAQEKFKESKFMALHYDNGDKYVGEVVNNIREGYGIYYWSNGNYWFGQYKNGVRDGFGALFTADGKLFIGKWKNEKNILK